MEVIGSLIGIALVVWMWLFSFRLFRACWQPAKASDKYIRIVHGMNGQFFTVFRTGSAVMLVYFSALLAGGALLLAVKSYQALAT